MKVLILCGGLGTRLREHTEFRPKPMVEIGGRPILWHIMKLYAHHGFTDFVVCLGYKGRMIREYFLNYEAMSSDITLTLGRPSIRYHGRPCPEQGWSVTLADTGTDAMTGARVRIASRHLGARPGTFAVAYGDGVSDVDLRKAYAFHRAHGKAATLTGVRPPSRFGELDHRGGVVTRFHEKPQMGQGLINGGYFFFEPGFLRYLSDETGCVLEREPLARCVADRQLMVYEHNGYWQCMDTVRDWESLERQWQSGRAPWKVWSTP